MINLLKSFFLSLLSLLIIFFLKYKRVDKAHFSSVKKEYDNYFDPRTKIYLKKKKTVFFIRSQNFFHSLCAFIKSSNIIFFNQILNLIFILEKFFPLKKENVNKINLLLLSSIVKFLRLKEFHMIDDYRHVKLFSKICEINKVELFLYQHGRFSISQPIQKNLKSIKFKSYYVWSHFFKNKLLKIDDKFDKKRIIIKKRFKKYTIKKNKLCNNILIPQENEISIKDYNMIINKILNSKIKFKIYFKFRPYEKRNLALEDLLRKNNVQIVQTKNIYNFMKKKKFEYLISFNSTMLLEASFFGVGAIMIYKKKPGLIDYVNDNVFFISKISTLNKNLVNFRKNKQTKIKLFKSKVWE